MAADKPLPKHRHRHRHKHNRTGTAAGTLIADPQSPKPSIHVIAYGKDSFTESDVTDLDTLKEFVAQWPVTWINVDGLGDLDIIRKLGQLFSLHRLALEDVLNLGQRPKVEAYDEHLFFVVHMLEAGESIHTEQLSIFLGDGFVLTFLENPGDCLDPVRRRIRDNRGRIRALGADHLAYSLVDAVVDAYFPYLDSMTEYLESLEDEVLTAPFASTAAKIHGVKRNLIHVRHSMSPLREAINSLIRDEDPRITEGTRLYLRDCYDHVIRIAELVDTLRDLAAGLLDVYLSSVSNRMNGVMKVLTVMSTMFIPLTFLAGVYGMNFHTDVSPWNMPELGWRWGYPMFILVILTIASIELGFFWWKGWFSAGALAPSRRKSIEEKPASLDEQPKPPTDSKRAE